MAKMHPPAHHEDAAAPLSGRAAVVTGASSGIGRAIALELAAAGADVLVHAHSNRAGAEETAAAVEQLGRASEVLLCDLAVEEAAAELASQAIRWREEIHVWINNAGADVLTGEAADWPFERKLDLLWRTDVRGTMLLARHIGQTMKQRRTPGAAILNMGWDQAETGMGGDSGEMFAAVKGAVMAFTQSLAKSLAPEVRVNCLAPGWIKTAWGDAASDKWQRRAASESLLGRWGTPEDVARVARFLVSPDAAFMTGQIVRINGGLGTSP